MNCNKIFYDKNCNTIVQDTDYNSGFVYVYVLQLNHTTGVKDLVFIKTSLELQIVFNLGLDGFYTLITLKVPIGPGESPYYYLNEKFYHIYDEIDLLDLIELNPINTGLEVNYDYYFLTCRLKKCFINICYLIFETSSSISCNNSKLDSSLIYKRDLIWSALNVIKFMIELDLYEEAERLLERIMGCNGLCDNFCHDSHNISNCGCK